MRIFLTTSSLAVLATGEACETPEWVVQRFLVDQGIDPEESWYSDYARNKRWYADVTEVERDRLVLCCAWAGDNIFSQRYDGQHSRSGGFGPSMYDVVMREAKLMWRTADRLAAVEP